MLPHSFSGCLSAHLLRWLLGIFPEPPYSDSPVPFPSYHWGSWVAVVKVMMVIRRKQAPMQVSVCKHWKLNDVSFSIGLLWFSLPPPWKGLINAAVKDRLIPHPSFIWTSLELLLTNPNVFTPLDWTGKQLKTVPLLYFKPVTSLLHCAMELGNRKYNRQCFEFVNEE